MALPTVVKTWQFNCNNAIVAQGTSLKDHQTLMLAIKNAMLGFGTLPWTVAYSCNSVTAGTAGDGVDRWTTFANLVWASGASVHSWIVLKQTGIGSNCQILITLNASAASPNVIIISMSPSAGFTGGSTTANPTATDQIGNVGTNWTNISTDVATRWTVMQSTDGQCTRIVVYASGVKQSFIAFEKFANPTGGTPGASNSGYFCNSSSAVFTLNGFTLQNAVASAVVISYEATSNIAIASEVSGVFDIFPVAAACTATTGARGRLGTFQDMWLGCSSVADGDVYPATGSPAAQFIQIGNSIILPWNNGPVNLT